MLTKQLKGTLPATLTLVGQGESVTFNVTFHNRTQDDFLKQLSKVKGLPEFITYLVESWETEYEITTKGVTEAESARPGFCQFIIDAFHEARKVGAAKNSASL